MGLGEVANIEPISNQVFAMRPGGLANLEPIDSQGSVMGPGELANLELAHTQGSVESRQPELTASKQPDAIQMKVAKAVSSHWAVLALFVVVAGTVGSLTIPTIRPIFFLGGVVAGIGIAFGARRIEDWIELQELGEEKFRKRQECMDGNKALRPLWEVVVDSPKLSSSENRP